MRDNMDVNAGSIADGERTIDEVGREIFDTWCWPWLPASGPAPSVWATANSSPGGSGR